MIEHFPIGRRLAFDTEKGRLWVVCRSCTRWNLSPLEERWEAIEECERFFRSTRLRVSTEHIGLARLREGLELVRIGAPQRPEFAAWRYGERFRGRRRKYVAHTGFSVVTFGAVSQVVGSLSIGMAVAAGLGTAVALLGAGSLVVNVARKHGKLLPVRIPAANEQVIEIERVFAGQCRLRSATNDEGWELQVPNTGKGEVLTGNTAVHALGLILPHVNQAGARTTTVHDAVQEVEALDSPREYFTVAEAKARKAGWAYGVLQDWPRTIRLALEMAAHEDEEKLYLEGELHLLERAWREAEEIAAVADTLALPERVTTALAKLRR